MLDIKAVINRVVDGVNLEIPEMEEVFNFIMGGEATPSQIASFITAMRMKGETVDEITGAARIMRKFAAKIKVENPENTIDTCGTGGDRSHTFNISTVSAIIAASCGIPVAKHGNRSVSSSCGSADVLSQLGVNLEINTDKVSECISQAGIGFLFAPMLHSSMQYAIGPRKEIGIRTIFNLLGPLTNPANAQRQVMGVFDSRWVKPLAAVLQNLGSIKVMVVHGSDGLDEITTTDKTFVCELSDNKLKEYEIDPQKYGLSYARHEDLLGGDATRNAEIVTGILSGEKGHKRDIVLLNAAAAVYVSGKAKDLKEGIEIAAAAIDSGKSKKTLDTLIKVSRS